LHFATFLNGLSVSCFYATVLSCINMLCLVVDTPSLVAVWASCGIHVISQPYITYLFSFLLPVATYFSFRRLKA
jgi:hypothetical protein